MFVSFVVATYNCVDLVPTLVDTANRLQGLDCEFCVSDGGSTDGTADALKASPLLNVVRSAPDRGIYDAWNHAIPSCRGEYLAFIGVDDQPQLDFLVSAKKSAHEAVEPPSLIYGDRHLQRRDKIRRVKSPAQPRLLDPARPVFDIPHQAALNHKRLFEHRVFDGHFRLGGDLEFYIGVRDLILKYGHLYLPQPQVIADAEGVSRSVSAYSVYLKEYAEIEARHGVRIAQSKLRFRLLSLLEYAPGIFRLGKHLAWKFRSE